MKKIILFLLTATFFAGTLHAQHYDIKKLKTTVEIWSEIYLLHPSVVRSDKQVGWEKHLVDFLPVLKTGIDDDEFTDAVNTTLLHPLEDRLTVLQPRAKELVSRVSPDRPGADESFEYVAFTENQLSMRETLGVFEEIDPASTKPLVIDFRIAKRLDLVPFNYGFLEYFLSAFLEKPLILNPLFQREHFGWDEYNDWWFYEQRWKVAVKDKAQRDNGVLKPIAEYGRSVRQYLKGVDLKDSTLPSRPVYLLTNNSFLSYYGFLLKDFRDSRPNTYILNEDRGRIYSFYGGDLIRYEMALDHEFILNPVFNGSDPAFDLETETLTVEQLKNFIASEKRNHRTATFPSLHIRPARYESTGEELSDEEKILGIAKIYSIIRYFHVRREQIKDEWRGALETNLRLALETTSDKEYFEFIRKMTVLLEDSHVSVYHPKLIDLSAISVAPIWFEWIDGMSVVTFVEPNTDDVQKGDRILAIDGKRVEEIVEEHRTRISHNNEQGVLATAVHPGNFADAEGSRIRFTLLDGENEKTVDLERSVQIYRFFGEADRRQNSTVLEGNIGYINMAAMGSSSALENELIRMKDTDGLIIDLRRSYPPAPYQRFLSMLCQEKTVIRLAENPVVSGGSATTLHYLVTECEPAEDFHYAKPIVVLIDKTMKSRPEDMAIGLSAFPNVTFVGEQTHGTDGEATMIDLPGGGSILFTGQLIKYPDGSDFMGRGIIPDVEVIRTIEGIQENRDEILEKGVELLRDTPFDQPENSGL